MELRVQPGQEPERNKKTKEKGSKFLEARLGWSCPEKQATWSSLIFYNTLKKQRLHGGSNVRHFYERVKRFTAWRQTVAHGPSQCLPGNETQQIRGGVLP